MPNIRLIDSQNMNLNVTSFNSSWTGSEKYIPERETSPIFDISFEHSDDDSSVYLESPPLSNIELDDIIKGLQEAITGTTKRYTDVEEALRDLQTERTEFQRDNQG